MRKLNDIGFFMIALFVVNSISYSVLNHPENRLFPWTLAILFMFFGLTYFAAKLARKKSKKQLIGGEKISIA